MRKTCKSSAASRESIRPPCNRSFRRAVNSVLENRSFMVVITSDLDLLISLDSLPAVNVACNFRAESGELSPYTQIPADWFLKPLTLRYIAWELNRWMR